MINTEHKNAISIKDWFLKSGKQISCNDETIFQIYKDVCYNGSIVDSLSIKDRVRVAKIQISFIRKNVLGILHEHNGKSSKGIKEGYVYAISNPAWNDYVKIGSSVDVYDRLSSYQTSSPLRDYELVGYVFSNDRLSLEKEIHSKFERNNEWIKTDKNSIKRFLKDHEKFPITEIKIFSTIETIKAIGKSTQVISAEHDGDRIRRFFTMAKAAISVVDESIKDVNIFDKSLLKRENHCWTSLALGIKVKIHENCVIVLEN